MFREENIQQLEKQNESLSFIRSDLNKIILKWIKKNATGQPGFLGSFLHTFSKEQHDQLVDFYRAVNPVNHLGQPLCDRAFLVLCREKMNTAVIPQELKMTLSAAVTAGEATLAMRDKLLLLTTGVMAGFFGSQSSILTVFILAVLAVLYKDVAKMGVVFDFVCKLGDKLDSLAHQAAQQQAPAIGFAK